MISASGARRVACLTSACLTSACLAAAAAACGGRDVGTANGPAYTQLYESLGRPAGLRVQGDTAVVVTVLETRGMRRADRDVAARVNARTVAREWNTGRLRRVTTVFRHATRLGPFILRTRDDSVPVGDAGLVAPGAVH